MIARRLFVGCIVLVVSLLSATVLRASELHDAVAKGDLLTVEKLLAANPSLIDQKALFKNEAEGWTLEGTPLHIAAIHERKDVVRLLLLKGATVNAKDESDFTPLHLAAVRCNTEITELLLLNGANPNAVNKEKMTPLHLAVADAAFGKLPSPEQRAAMVKLLLSKGANPNAKGPLGKTPLHIAAEKGLTAAVEVLATAKGVDLNIEDDDGKTALQVAEANNQDAAAHILYKSSGKTPPLRSAVSRPTEGTMENLPPKASLRNVQKTFTNRQRGGMFCIPCGIETAFKYYGVNTVTQEKLVLAWVKAGGRLQGRGGMINTRGKTDEQIIEAARGAVLWGANFQNFKRVTDASVDMKGLGYELVFAVVKTLDEYAKILKHAIANDWVFIMSYSAGGGAHIVNAVAYDGNKVTIWEPQGGRFHTRPLAEFKPNFDLLILRPIQKKQ